MAASVKSTLLCAKHPSLLVILGATGTGKSKLAIELATKFKQEIISIDSMQIYKGLDIVTNKASLAERQMVPHYLIDFADPLSRFTVTDFRNHALKIIYNLIDKGKMPVLVGGTNYYIESLLWKVLIDSENNVHDELLYEQDKRQTHVVCDSANTTTDFIEQKLLLNGNVPDYRKEGKVLSACCLSNKKGTLQCSGNNETSDVSHKQTISPCEHSESANKHFHSVPFHGESEHRPNQCDSNSSDSSYDHNYLYDLIMKRKITAENLDHIPSQLLHNLLSRIDPNMSEQLHPFDRRKVIRSLQIFQQHGKTHSEILSEQRGLPGGSSLGGPLRFKNLCILWLQCNQEVLNERLDKRVDQMIEEGLIEELHNFHSAYNQHRLKNNLEADYTKGIFQSIGFKEFHNYLILNEEQRKTVEGEQLLNEGISVMKQVTKRYSKKQIKWILNRFLRRADRSMPPVYALDATDVSQWKEKVLDPAIGIVEAFIQGKQPEIPALPVEERSPVIRKTYVCEVCQRIFVRSDTWESHLKSRRHAKMKRKQNQLNESTDNKVEEVDINASLH